MKIFIVSDFFLFGVKNPLGTEGRVYCTPIVSRAAATKTPPWPSLASRKSQWDITTGRQWHLHRLLLFRSLSLLTRFALTFLPACVYHSSESNIFTELQVSTHSLISEEVSRNRLHFFTDKHRIFYCVKH